MSIISLHSNGTTLVLDNPDSVSAGTVITYNSEKYLVVSDGNNSGHGIQNYNDSFEYTVGSNTYDMQHIITTKVTDMASIFYNKKHLMKIYHHGIHLMLLLWIKCFL